MKKPVKISLIVLGVLVCLFLIRNVTVKSIIGAGVRMITGLKLDIQKLDIGVFRSLVNIEKVKLYNPKGFNDKVMADIPQIYAAYDLGGFFRGKTHLREVKLNLKEFIVVKNEKGEVNIDSLKVIKDKKGKGLKKRKSKQKFRMDVLDLKIGRVLYKDYTQIPPSVKEYKININQRFKDINDPAGLVSLIVFKALASTTINNLIDLDLNILADGIGGTLKGVKNLADGAVGKVFETGGDIKDKAKEAVNKLIPFGK